MVKLLNKYDSLLSALNVLEKAIKHYKKVKNLKKYKN